MRYVLSAALVALVSTAVFAQESKPQTLDDFLALPARVNDVKTIGLVLVSMTDPAVAPKNTGEMVRNHWAARPQAGLDPDQARLTLRSFEQDWNRVAAVIRERKMTSISFIGIDLVMLKEAQDWYFGGVTPRGPVLVRLSVQFNPDAPLSIHGVQVWTDWEEIKAITRKIDLPAGRKVLSVTYKPKDPKETDPDEKKL